MDIQTAASSFPNEDPRSEYYYNLKDVLFVVGTGIGGYFVAKWIGQYALNKYRKYVRDKEEKKRKEKWANVGQGVVVLSQYPRSVLTPSPSPFALKLETYLRMAKIPYQNDLEERFSPDGEKIRIVLNGEEIVSSQSSMEFLARKFQKDFSSSMSPIEKATASAFQILCEEHLYWALVLWWFKFSEGETLPMILPTMPRSQIKKETCWEHAVFFQAVGNHTKAEVTEMASKDLRALSLYLGTKPYFTGEQPAEVDCAFFGILAQIVWSAPGSFMEKLVQSELPNLVEFCERMKAKFWPDWNQCLGRREILD